MLNHYCHVPIEQTIKFYSSTRRVHGGYAGGRTGNTAGVGARRGRWGGKEGGGAGAGRDPGGEDGQAAEQGAAVISSALPELAVISRDI